MITQLNFGKSYPIDPTDLCTAYLLYFLLLLTAACSYCKLQKLHKARQTMGTAYFMDMPQGA
jgi:hypothetical protein